MRRRREGEGEFEILGERPQQRDDLSGRASPPQPLDDNGTQRSRPFRMGAHPCEMPSLSLLRVLFSTRGILPRPPRRDPHCLSACKRTPKAVALAAPRVGCESRREAPENSARWATDAWRMRAHLRSSLEAAGAHMRITRMRLRMQAPLELALSLLKTRIWVSISDWWRRRGD
jgi:hypothetical protein